MNHISEAEWKLMEALWETPDSSFSELASALEGNGWSESTVKTLLRRLVDKGYVQADRRVGNHFKYRPAVKEADCRREEARSFLSRVFNGSVSMFLSSLADGKLSKGEQERLEALISRLEEDENGNHS